MSMRIQTNAPMEQFKRSDSSSWRYEQITISGSALKTLTFLDSTPNMFLIQNSNKATLHIGLSAIPTLEECEFKVNPNSSKAFGRPIPCTELYIRNCSTQDITISLFSYYGTFDMSILNSSDVDITGTELHTTITGIEKALPSGANHIGSVNLSDSIPSGNNKIGKIELSEPIPTGKNNIGTVGITGNVAVTNDNFKTLGTINTVINAIKDKINGAIGTNTYADIIKAIGNIKVSGMDDETKDTIATINSNLTLLSAKLVPSGTPAIYCGADNIEISATDGTLFFKMISNDSDTDMTIPTGYGDFILKAGETITDLDTNLTTCSIGKGSKRVIAYGIGSIISTLTE